MSDYTRGPTYARRHTPRFYFKNSSPGYTGGGYAMVRSKERRDHTPGDGLEDVYVAVHRLAAVAWHLPDGTLGDDVRLADLDGVDVHHTQPDSDERGMPAANGEAWTELLDHGRHSEVTNAERRAWAEADRERAESAHAPSDRCSECGTAGDASWAVEGRDGALCLSCATSVADGRTITEA